MENEANRIIDALGGTGEVAALCRLNPAAVSQWRKRGIPISWQRFFQVTHPKLFKKAGRK